MSRSVAGLLALVTLFALSIAACGGEDAETTPPAGENAAPAGNGTDGAAEDMTDGDEAANPEVSAPDTGNAQLAVLREKAAQLSKKIDEYTSELDGLGDMDALNSQISKLRKSTAVLMGGALEKAKEQIAALEAKLGQYDDAFDARKTLYRELAEVEASIKELGGE